METSDDIAPVTDEAAKSVLAEVVMHLEYDAGVNGSRFTDNPYGRLVLSYEVGSLWRRVWEAKKTASSDLVRLIEAFFELVYGSKISENEKKMRHVDLHDAQGLFRSIRMYLGYKPDIIADVVAPAVLKETVRH